MPLETVISIKPFDGLTALELHACLRLRGEVFVVEQQICAVPDVDEDDPKCHHVLMSVDGELAGTARLGLSHRDHTGVKMFGAGRGPHTVKVGRVAVAQKLRGKGLGTAMMRHIQEWIRGYPWGTGQMSAQGHLEGWYTALGWTAEGDHYLEAGIDHVKMVFKPA